MAEDRNALASAIRARREALGLTQVDVWKRRGGPSNSTQTAVESAASGRITASTLRKFDTALEWPLGTAAGILATGKAEPSAAEPRPVPHPPERPAVDLVAAAELIAALRDIREAADRAMLTLDRMLSSDLSAVSDADLAAELLRRVPDVEALMGRPRA